jgi:hypothetical protein
VFSFGDSLGSGDLHPDPERITKKLPKKGSKNKVNVLKTWKYLAKEF